MLQVQPDFWAESCAIGDYNADGIPDLSSGREEVLGAEADDLDARQAEELGERRLLAVARAVVAAVLARQTACDARYKEFLKKPSDASEWQTTVQ